MICPECGYQRVAHNGYCPICKQKERMATSAPSGSPTSAPAGSSASATTSPPRTNPSGPYPESHPHFTAGGSPTAPPSGAPATDSLVLALGIIGFFFPLVGLILYLALLGSEPQRARSAGRGALWGTLFWLVLASLPVFIERYTKS